jgi:hypothetical protein
VSESVCRHGKIETDDIESSRGRTQIQKQQGER